MAEKATEKIPEEVVATFEHWLGMKIDETKIVKMPDDDYEACPHGKFDLYALRRDGSIFQVRKYFNGNVEFK